ncbi:hypothetical protein BAY61_03650 [Prauserella marina]|uniref:Uncharacterized protein n=1 Tax=Prauserella marina TaxID=530584 RepID=A0A222VK78_9PSEU|nr:DUF559 domain-containing protein [Prauserella marina]ASR34232.1 hypothetical protein BAY61_03650 [Prauserella marina]PWV72003.1 uncharacterized protein DUF559 [Prauserella marina]SDD93006.1 Protein of unknown function [Prauserella marina]
MTQLPQGLHGAYLRSDLVRELGPPVLRGELEAGRLVSYSRTVVVDSRRRAEFCTRAAAAVLGAGPHAILTGPTALALHGCTAADTAPVHLLVPYGHKPRSSLGVKVHHGAVLAEDLVELDGLPVLALDFAAAEVLSHGTRRTALACTDQALRLLPETDRPRLRAWIEHRVRTKRDPRGRRRAQAVLNLATGLAESPPESWLLLSLVEGGLPIPRQQVSIVDLAGNEIYRLDFAWPEQRVAVEYDGYEAHERRHAYDRARDADLRRRGWMVIRADAEDLKAPGRLIAEVKTAFRIRGLAA